MWRASFKFLISSYDSYCHCEKASFGECLALVSVQGSWVYLLSEPLKAWWLNFLLSVARREIEASIFVPLWFLMRNAVSFSVTFDFGFNSSFMTKRKKTHKTEHKCFLPRSVFLNVEWLLLQACWSGESSLGNHLYAFPAALYSEASTETWGPEMGVDHLIAEHSDHTPWSRRCLSETDQLQEEFRRVIFQSLGVVQFHFVFLAELFTRETRTWGQAQVLPTRKTDASSFWLCVLHYKKLLCLCVVD